MTKKQNILLKASIAIAVLFAIAPASNAMHIMEGYLQATFCIAWGVICLPFIVAGLFSIQKHLKQNRKNTDPSGNVRSLCVCDFFLEDPVCDRKLFPYDRKPDWVRSYSGPTAAGVLGLIVLLFQAILLAHGGLTTLGANTFSMAIAGPFLSYGIYKLCQKLNVNRKVAVFLAAFFGDLFTYCVTSLQLAMAYPSEAGGVGASAVKFLGVFAPTQLPLAVMEGLLTVVIVIALESYAKPELKAVGFLKEEK